MSKKKEIRLFVLILSIVGCISLLFLIFSMIWSVLGVNIVSSIIDDGKEEVLPPLVLPIKETVGNGNGYYSSQEHEHHHNPWDCDTFNSKHASSILGKNLSQLDGKCTVSFDQHSHTDVSDGGQMSAKQTVVWHRMMGYDAFAVTDHNKMYNCDEVKKAAHAIFPGSMVVICGVEWTTNKFHVNILFPPSLIVIPLLFDTLPYRDVNVSVLTSIIEYAHSLGALAVLNHPTATTQFHKNTFPIPVMVDAGVDYIEVLVWNGVDEAARLFYLEDDPENKLGIIAGSDVHIPFLNTRSYTILGIDSHHLTEENVFSALLAKNSAVSQTPRPS